MSLPVGTVVGMIGQDPRNPPAGWLYCNGAGFDGDKYPELAKILSNNVLPNLVGLTLMGASQGTPYPPSNFGFGSGTSQNPDGTYGSTTHTMALTEMPSHQHFGMGKNFGGWPFGTYEAFQFGSNFATDYINFLYGTTFTGGASSGTSSAQPNTAFSLIQPTYAIYFFICAATKNAPVTDVLREEDDSDV